MGIILQNYIILTNAAVSGLKHLLYSWMNVRVSKLCDLSEVAMLELYWFYTAGLKSVLMSPIMLLL